MLRAVFVASIAAVLAVAPTATAKRHKQCAVRGAAPIARSTQAVLLSRDVMYDELTDATEIYGCLRKRRRPLYLDAVSSDQYASSSFDAVELSGTFAALATGTRFVDGSCNSDLTVYSLVHRSSKHTESIGQGNEHDGCPTVRRLVVNRRGFAAWLQSRVGASDALYEVDNHPSHLLDAGAVDPASLRFNGSVLSWTNAGVQHTAALH